MKQSAPYVLMLEDDSDDRYVTQSFFTDQAYKVGLHFIEDPFAVVPYLEQCLHNGDPLPGLIILDKNVPAKSGTDVLRDLKTDQRFSTIPVVMISGTAFPGEVEQAYRLGVNSFITKPVNHELTVKKIDTCIRYWFEIVDLPVVGKESVGLR